MTETVAINFTKFGNVQALYDERFPIDFLGPQKIERLTTVEWVEQYQAWLVQAHCETKTGGYFFKRRDRAIEFERAWYYQSIVAGYAGLDDVTGYALYQQYRDIE